MAAQVADHAVLVEQGGSLGPLRANAHQFHGSFLDPRSAMSGPRGIFYPDQPPSITSAWPVMKALSSLAI
jgi:hypothetical protein